MENSIFFGVVEDRDDYNELGRCRVRIAGMHTHDRAALPTEDLPWAVCIQPVGSSTVQPPPEGTQVVLTFADPPFCQIPVIIGQLPSIPQSKSVYINEFPDQPSVRNTASRELAKSLNRDQHDYSATNSREVTNGVTDTDKNVAKDVINNNSKDTTSSVKLVGDPSSCGQTQGRSSCAVAVTLTYGNANPSPNQSLVINGIQQGSETKALEKYGLSLSNPNQKDLISNILSGKVSLSTAIDTVQQNIGNAIVQGGTKLVDKALSSVLGEGGTGALGQISSGVGQIASSLENGLSYDGIIGAINGVGDVVWGIADSPVGDAIAAAGSGLSSIGEGIGSLISGDNGLTSTEQSLTNISGELVVGDVDGLLDNPLGSSDSLLVDSDNIVNNAGAIGDSILTTAEQLPQSVIDSASTMISNWIDSTKASPEEITSMLTGPGGQLANFAADAITSSLRSLLAQGVAPLKIVLSIFDPLEKAVNAAKGILTAAAAAIFRENWDPSYITDPIKQLLASWKAILLRAISVVIDGGNNLIDWITEQFNNVAATILDIFGIGAGTIAEFLSAIPFSGLIVKAISGMISSFLPSGSGNKAPGLQPAQSTSMISNGTFNTSTLGDIGCRSSIDKIGKSKVTSATFGDVGEGNTPPLNGKYGGPNYQGGKQTNRQRSSINPQTNPSMATRSLNATCPPNVILYDNHTVDQVNKNLKQIKEKLSSYGITTLEAQAAFCAIGFAYNNLYSDIADYEYDDRISLINKFPRSFGQSDDSVITKYLFARSQNKCTSEQFYNFVYDSATDGLPYGNTSTGDGWKFAEAGIVPTIGRSSYVAIGAVNGTSDITSNYDNAIKYGALMFLNAINGVPGGSPSVFYKALAMFPNVNRTLATTAFEHFYQASVFDSYGTTTKIAGKQYDVNSYYGSKQDTTNPAGTVGFQDPNGKYPYGRSTNESTVNKLARGDAVNTIVTAKEVTRLQNVPIAGSTGTWSQPHSSYAAVYPYNNVNETESGHVIELDDTPGHERIHFYHRTGTFVEYYPNGSKVTRVVGDNYEIVDRNGMVSISGDANIDVIGNINISCHSNANIDVDGSADIVTHGSLGLAAADDVNISAGKNINLYANEGLNLQCRDNINVRTQNGALYLTAKNDINIVSDGYTFLTTKDSLYVHGGTDVCIEAEQGIGSFRAYDTASIGSFNGGLQLYGATNAALSGGRNVNIYAAVGIHQQCLANFTILSTGWARIQSSALDINTLGYLHASAAGEISVSATGAVNVAATGALSLGATGAVNINAGGALTTSSSAMTSIRSNGIIGIDGTIIGLNTGLSSPPIPVVTIPALISGFATKASLAPTAPTGEKAIIYGMATVANKAPANPSLPLLTSEDPLIKDEQPIETIEQLSTSDGDIIAKATYVSEGKANPIEGPSVTPSGGSQENHIDGSYINTLHSTSRYTANVKVSDHFNLGDFFDGGFNKRHVLQPQGGLTIEQIVDNISYVANNILEKIVDILPGGINGYRKQWRITSGYRSIAGNQSSGGSSTSQHCKGQAVDIQLTGGSKSEHYNLIQKIATKCRYDQLILEYSINGRTAWIHCSYNKDNCRGQSLTINLCNRKITNGKFVLYG